ncbi:MAG: hypothetical protein HY919_09040, partial [Elusimicrobia bacterium]|nr:hypothetical protein [Elusimicrobiota bacterium]
KEIDLLRERFEADRELQKQEWKIRIDSEIASKLDLEKNYQSAIAQKTAEFEKNIRERTEEWNIKIEKTKSDYENRIKQVESENKFSQQEMYKKLEENNTGWQKKLETEKTFLENKLSDITKEFESKKSEIERSSAEKDSKWRVSLEELKNEYQNKIAKIESEKSAIVQEMHRRFEESNSTWQKKFETEKKYLEDKVSNYDSELEARKKQWAEESEKFRTIITRNENDIIVIKTNYENRLTEMTKSENNLKTAIEKLSADLLSEREKFSKELSEKTKEFEAKYAEIVETKNMEFGNIEKVHLCELKSASVENESKINELKKELNSARCETETIREKWLEDKKLWLDETAKKTSVSDEEQRGLLIKKAELEAVELKLKMNEKALDERVNMEKQKYEEMLNVKNEQMGFLKEQLKNMEDEMDEKVKLIMQNSAVDKSAVREKEQEVEKLKDSIEHYKKVIEELEREISGILAENKQKEEKIILMQKENELKLSGQKEKLDSEFSKKMADIEKKYNAERKMVEESLLNANTQNLSEIEKLKKEIEIFKSAQAWKIAVLDAKRSPQTPPSPVVHPVKESPDKKFLTKMWKWLNEPV